MAAEDYIDFAHLHGDDIHYVTGGDQVPDFGMTRARNKAHNSLVRKHVDSAGVRQTKNQSNKNRNIEWTTGQGEILRLADMEDSHLLNTIVYIRRRAAEFAEVEQIAHSRNLAVPQPLINKRPFDYWIDAMLKELNRREQKKIADAKKLLGVE